MIRIRFHGRGGQGVKTAARIVGRAGFFEGYTVQDSPIYGAERRGAPLTAFTRLDHGPIRERGLITDPDLLLVADARLLHDPTAHALDGVTVDTVVFINTDGASDAEALSMPATSRIVTLDLSALARAHLGSAMALSAALAGVAAKLAGLERESLRRATERELADIHLRPETVAANLSLAEACYDAMGRVPLRTAVPAGAAAPLYVPSYESPERGSAHITAVANTPLRHTGEWRQFRPVLQPDKCNGCWLCFAYCPDAAITMKADDRPVIDYDHCKGCMICVEECPTHALLTEPETGVR